jgi:hypothetical protein
MPYDYWTDGEEMQDPKYKRCCYHCRDMDRRGRLPELWFRDRKASSKPEPQAGRYVFWIACSFRRRHDDCVFLLDLKSPPICRASQPVGRLYVGL